MRIFNIEEYLYSTIKNLFGIYTLQFGHSQCSKNVLTNENFAKILRVGLPENIIL